MKELRIGMLGLGNVGTGVCNIFNMNKSIINSNAGSPLTLSKILVNNKNKKRADAIDEKILTEKASDILEDSNIDMVVELMGGLSPAYEYIKQALMNKKHVVTANKAIMATYGAELLSLAKENNVLLKYEASVGGGIPVLTSLSGALLGNEIEEIAGIINGTTNYILTQMIESGASYASVLKDAQDLGFAEADPTSDVEGEDVAYKLGVLSKIAYGIDLDPTKIPRQGITKIGPTDIEFSKEHGYKIKLLGVVKKKKDTLEFFVQPSFVPKDHLLASVNNEFNAVLVKGNAVGDLMYYGKGAGPLPTGSAVVGDLILIGQHINTHANNLDIQGTNASLKLMGELENKYYLRFSQPAHPETREKLVHLLEKWHITLENSEITPEGELIFLTECVKKVNLDQCIQAIKTENLDCNLENLMLIYGN